MYFKMRLKVALCTKAFAVTNNFFSYLYPNVIRRILCIYLNGQKVQKAMLLNRLVSPANVTLEWFLPGVNPHVYGKVVLLGETARTEHANEWLVTRVSSEIHIK